jgi:hypothetical protein
MEIYQEIYQTFLTKYNKIETTPSEVGEVLAKLAGVFYNYNMTKIATEKLYAKVCRDEVLKTDEQTGKATSSSKAQTIADATQEASDYKTAKGHVENLEMQIGVLKFLQKSLEVEYLNSNI